MPMCLIVIFCLILFTETCSRSTFYISSPQTDGNNNTPIKVMKQTSEKTKNYESDDNCGVTLPSKENIQKLCTHNDCETIYCVRSCDCGNEVCRTPPRTTCFTKSCSAFRVSYSDDHLKREKDNVTLQQLSVIVNDHLLDMHKLSNIEVRCSDSNSFLNQQNFLIEIKENHDSCKSQDDVTSTARHTHQFNRNISNIHLIYFRFISKWESFVKLPLLNSLIEHKRNDSSWDLYTFENLQSLSFILDENLKLILGITNENYSKNNAQNAVVDDLLQLAIKNERCVIFEPLTCHKSELYDYMQKLVRKEKNIRNCQQSEVDYFTKTASHDFSNNTFCGNDEDNMDVEEVLYIQDRLGQLYSTLEANIFSVSIVNIPDLSSLNVFDTAITMAVARILSHQSNVVILLSDIGDPKFSRFDESVFLRTQTFNPLLHLFLPRKASQEPRALSSSRFDVSKSLIRLNDISDVYNLTKILLSSGETLDKKRMKLKAFFISVNTSRNYKHDIRSGSGCLAGQKGFVECWCLGKHALFPNDTVQVAFATFIVGSLNNKLLDLSSERGRSKEKTGSHFQENPRAYRFICDRFLGVRFDNIQHVLWKNSTYILMRLYLTPSTRKYSSFVRVHAMVEYSTDNKYNTKFSASILRPTKFILTSLSDSVAKNFTKLNHFLCQEYNELNKEYMGHLGFLKALASQTHFGVHGKTKSLHHPCLFLITRTFGDSAVVEAANVCSDRKYTLTVSAEFINVVSTVSFPVQAKLGPQEMRYIASMVKHSYSVSKFAYKMTTSYTVNIF